MAIQENPYLPPTARVEDAEIVHGNYIEGGRSVPSSHGWTWIADGWDLFRRQPGTWILIAFVFGVIFIGVSILPFVSIAAPVLMPIFIGGLMFACERLERGEDIGIGDLFSGFQAAGGELAIVGLIGLGLSIVAAIPAMVLMFAAVGFGSGFSGSMFALAILTAMALSLPIYMALWFASPLVAIQKLRPTRGIAESFRGCLKNIIPFLIYGVVLLVFAVLATIPAFLGWLVLGPVVIASVYAAYRDIFFES
jgi:hypothetical protein